MAAKQLASRRINTNTGTEKLKGYLIRPGMGAPIPTRDKISPDILAAVHLTPVAAGHSVDAPTLSRWVEVVQLGVIPAISKASTAVSKANH